MAMTTQSDSRAWIRVHLDHFDLEEVVTQIGRLAEGATSAGFTTSYNAQISSWRRQLEYLSSEFISLAETIPESQQWTLLLEYAIPRRGRRIDAVLLSDTVIYAIEFKVNASSVARADLWQAEDYALDLRDFHAQSDGYPVVPVLVCTGISESPTVFDGIQVPVTVVGSAGLSDVIAETYSSRSDPSLRVIDPVDWDRSAYRPTPTIVQATQQLFSENTVAEIASASTDNLSTTLDAIRAAIEESKATRTRTVCVVTGVPGAGKTLAGLSAIGSTGLMAVNSGEDRGAYLSGNGPLVRVLREAIARDSASKKEVKKVDAMRKASTLIQEVHKFVEEYGITRKDLAPDEHVVVYDEAQRAWNYKKLNQRHQSADRSEPGLMLEIMERPETWSVLIALVGGGQEIHSGEAGLSEWGESLARTGYPWRVLASPEALHGGASVSSHKLFQENIPSHIRVIEQPSMHLSVSIRSPRAEYLAAWIGAVLDCESDRARACLEQMKGFRIGLTRDLSTAKSWLRDAARDEFRPGLVASSGNARLRAYGIEMSPGFLEGFPIEHWFLNQSDDIRSSHALEVAMSEFKIQGLELDYIGMCWGDDLTLDRSGSWIYRRFRGSKWTAIHNEIDQIYLLNKYRVLLSRAREGLVIWVPQGDCSDPTREPARLDRVAQHLIDSGLELID